MELEELTELVNKLEIEIKELKELKEACWICGSKKEVTKHSLKGEHQPPYVPLCRKDHNKIELFKLIVKIMNKEKRLTIYRFKQLLKELDVTI